MSKSESVYVINEEGLRQMEADFEKQKYAWQLELLEWMENVKQIQGELTWWKLKREIKKAFNVLPDNYDAFFKRLMEDFQTEELLKRIR